MSPVKNPNELDQAFESIMLLNDDEKDKVLNFMKLLDLCEMLKLPAEQIPSLDEWKKTPEIVQWLIAIATDRLSISNGAYKSLLNSWSELKEELNAKKIQTSKPNKQNKKAAS